MITHVQFTLRFRKVERRTVTLRKNTDQEDQETQRLCEDVPSQESAETAGHLLCDDLAQIHRAGDEQQCDDAQPHRQLV